MHVRTSEDVQTALPAHPPKLLDQVRNAHYTNHIEKACLHSINRLILLHQKQYLRELIAPGAQGVFSVLGRNSWSFGGIGNKQD